MAAYVEDETHVPSHLLQDALAAQTRRALVHPVLFGSAVTGDGLESLRTGITDLLPVSRRRARGAGVGDGLQDRTRRERREDRVRPHVLGNDPRARTAPLRPRARGQGHGDHRLRTREAPSSAPRWPRAAVAKLWGLAGIQIGDHIGDSPATGAEHHFPPPTLESVVSPAQPDDGARAPRRARAARRTGSADRRPPGRQPGRALRLAVRRGAEGGDPGDAGRRVRPRRHLPRDDADLHRTAASAPGRRSSCSTPSRTPISPRSGSASIPRRTVPGSTSGCRSTLARLRCTSTRRSTASRSEWASTSGMRCTKASSAGRSPTAS